jgi:hypothetical protein
MLFGLCILFYTVFFPIVFLYCTILCYLYCTILCYLSRSVVSTILYEITRYFVVCFSLCLSIYCTLLVYYCNLLVVCFSLCLYIFCTLLVYYCTLLCCVFLALSIKLCLCVRRNIFLSHVLCKHIISFPPAPCPSDAHEHRFTRP